MANLILDTAMPFSKGSLIEAVSNNIISKSNYNFKRIGGKNLLCNFGTHGSSKNILVSNNFNWYDLTYDKYLTISKYVEWDGNRQPLITLIDAVSSFGNSIYTSNSRYIYMTGFAQANVPHNSFYPPKGKIHYIIELYFNSTTQKLNRKIGRSLKSRT